MCKVVRVSDGIIVVEGEKIQDSEGNGQVHRVNNVPNPIVRTPFPGEVDAPIDAVVSHFSGLPVLIWIDEILGAPDAHEEPKDDQDDEILLLI
jgi:hypothetical protein